MKEILHILEGGYFGDRYFEAFRLLRNSKLVSILTYNTEVIHGLSKYDIQCLDKIDLMLTRKALKLSSKSSRCLIMLELNLVSIEYIIKSKRIQYLHSVLTSDDSSLARNVLLQQSKTPISGDFVSVVKKDMKEFRINLSYEEIMSYSKSNFKKLVRDSFKKNVLFKFFKSKRKTK